MAATMTEPTTAATTAATTTTTPVRMYMGGLAPDVTEQEMRERFGRIARASGCELTTVELVRARADSVMGDAGACRGFAYVTLVGTEAAKVMDQIASAYHRTKWRGSVLRVERARPDFQAKLTAEWEAQREAETRRRDEAAIARARVLPTVVGVGCVGVGVGVGVGKLKTSVVFKGKRRTTFDEVAEEDLGAEQEEVGDEEDLEEEESTDQEEEEEMSSSESDAQEEDGGEEEEEEEEEEEQVVRKPVGRAEERVPVAPMSAEEVNARRLAALEEKRAKKPAASGGFVGKIDLTGGTPATKITFGDSDDETDETGPVGEGGGKRVVTNWMDSEEEEEEKGGDYGELDDERMLAPRDGTQEKLDGRTLVFGDDDAEGGGARGDGDEEEPDWFAVRPEFLGERGKELFELQKRFGGDQRFRMDARFMDDNENEFGGNQDLLADEGDEEEEAENMKIETEEELQTFQEAEGAALVAQYEAEMAGELEQALRVVEDIFPDLDVDRIRQRLAARTQQDPIKEASWMGAMMRYDPRVVASNQYVLSADPSSWKGTRGKRGDEKGDDSDDDGEGDNEALRDERRRMAEEKKKREEKEVLVGGDRFYSTTGALSNLFSRVRKNSEDGMEGEAALDGVFQFSSAWGGGGEGGGESKAGTGDSGEGTTVPKPFTLSSLFDSALGGDDGKQSLVAMGADLLGDEDEDEQQQQQQQGGDQENNSSSTWQFASSFTGGGWGSTGRNGHDASMEEAEEGGTDNEAEEGEEEDALIRAEREKKISAAVASKVKRSLAEFLAFGRTFVAPSKSTEESDVDVNEPVEDDEEEEEGDEVEEDDNDNEGRRAEKKQRKATKHVGEVEWKQQWLERRKKLTLDFKRKRRDALKNKKKQAQQPAAKRQKGLARGL